LLSEVIVPSIDRSARLARSDPKRKVRSTPTTMMTNRTGLFSVACWLITALASAQCVAATRLDMPSVTLRIDDYATADAGPLVRAQDEVRRIYAAIGVETTWLDTRHLARLPPGMPVPAGVGVADVTIMMLNRSMTSRLAPPLGAVGLAATTPAGGGRIAYVFYDRLQTIVLGRNANETAALSLVIAHEIGHLLLPHGSHSDAGIMRGHWDLEGWRHLDIRRLRFTPLQGQHIRRVLEQFVGPLHVTPAVRATDEDVQAPSRLPTGLLSDLALSSSAESAH
jgi:hypothetical protein